MKITNKEFILFFSVFTICFLILWKIYIYNNVNSDINVLKENISKNQKIIYTTEKYLKTSKNEILKRISEKKNNENFSKYVFENQKQLNNVINKVIYKNIKKFNIKIIESNKGKIKALDKNTFKTNFLNIKLESTYSDYYNFLRIIEKSEYQILVNSFSIKTKDNNIILVDIGFIGLISK